jgi:hypothetical protein
MNDADTKVEVDALLTREPVPVDRVLIPGFNHNEPIPLLDLSRAARWVLDHMELKADTPYTGLDTDGVRGQERPATVTRAHRTLPNHPIWGTRDTFYGLFDRDIMRRTLPKYYDSLGKSLDDRVYIDCFYAAFALGPSTFCTPLDVRRVQEELKQHFPNMKMSWMEFGAITRQSLLQGRDGHSLDFEDDDGGGNQWITTPAGDPQKFVRAIHEIQKPAQKNQQSLLPWAKSVLTPFVDILGGVFPKIYGDSQWSKASVKLEMKGEMAQAVLCTAEVLSCKMWTQLKRLAMEYERELDYTASEELEVLLTLAREDATLAVARRHSRLVATLQVYDEQTAIENTSIDIIEWLIECKQRPLHTAIELPDPDQCKRLLCLLANNNACRSDLDDALKRVIFIRANDMPEGLQLPIQPNERQLFEWNSRCLMWVIYPIVSSDIDCFIYALSLHLRAVERYYNTPLFKNVEFEHERYMDMAYGFPTTRGLHFGQPSRPPYFSQLIGYVLRQWHRDTDQVNELGNYPHLSDPRGRKSPHAELEAYLRSRGVPFSYAAIRDAIYKCNDNEYLAGGWYHERARQFPTRRHRITLSRSIAH